MMGKVKDRTVVGFFAVIVILFLVFAFSGGIIPTQTQQVFQITQPSPAALDACKASVGNPAIIGKGSTVTVNAYDMQSNTPYSAAVDVQAYITGPRGGITKTADTSAYSLSLYSVGDVIRVNGGNGSYINGDIGLSPR